MHVIAIGFLICVFLICVLWFNNYISKPSEYTRKVFQVWCRYESARRQLIELHKKCTFIQFLECQEGSRLVFEMIDAQKKLLDMGASKDKKHLESLYRLIGKELSV